MLAAQRQILNSCVKVLPPGTKFHHLQENKNTNTEHHTEKYKLEFNITSKLKKGLDLISYYFRKNWIMGVSIYV